MEVVAGAAAVVRNVMVGAVLGVLMALPKQNPYMLHCPVQHTSCTYQRRLQQEEQCQMLDAGRQTSSGLVIVQHVTGYSQRLITLWSWGR